MLHVAAVGFFVCSAVVLKAAAMFHPETLDLFLSTLALLLAARMIVRDDYRPSPAVALGAALGAAQLVRAFALWTFAVVLLALLAAAFVDAGRRRRILAAAAIAVAATAAVAGPWYVYQSRSHSNPIFDRPQVAKPLWERRPVEFYVDPGLPELITRPYRPSFENRFWPTLYAEGWGDWFGVFAWQAGKGDPDPGARRELTAQSLAGLLPTGLAVVGWLWLLARSARRLRSAPELLARHACSPSQASRGCSTSPSATRPRTETSSRPPTCSRPCPPGRSRSATRPSGPSADAQGLCSSRCSSAAAFVSLRFAVYGSPLGGLL